MKLLEFSLLVLYQLSILCMQGLIGITPERTMRIILSTLTGYELGRLAHLLSRRITNTYQVKLQLLTFTEKCLVYL